MRLMIYEWVYTVMGMDMDIGIDTVRFGSLVSRMEQDGMEWDMWVSFTPILGIFSPAIYNPLHAFLFLYTVRSI